MATQIRDAYPKINLLICNAGVLLHPNNKKTFVKSGELSSLGIRNTSSDNLEIDSHLIINCLASIVLFNTIKSSMENLKESKAVFVSSCTYRAGDLSRYLNSMFYIIKR